MDLFVPIAILFVTLSMIFLSPIRQGICRSSLDLQTQLPHRRMASLALFLTLLGICVPLISFFSLPMLSRSQIRTGFHHVESMGGEGQGRAGAFSNELISFENQLQKSIEKAPAEARPELEARLREFRAESNKSRAAFWDEVDEYHNDLDPVVDKYFHDAWNRQETVIMTSIAFLSAFAVALAVQGSIFGWWYLKRIRMTPEKPAWIQAMTAAFIVTLPAAWLLPLVLLLCPIYALNLDRSNNWIVPTAFLVGSVIGIGLIALIVWLTFRWLFHQKAVPDGGDGETQ